MIFASAQLYYICIIEYQSSLTCMHCAHICESVLAPIKHYCLHFLHKIVLNCQHFYGDLFCLVQTIPCMMLQQYAQMTLSAKSCTSQKKRAAQRTARHTSLSCIQIGRLLLQEEKILFCILKRLHRSNHLPLDNRKTP